MAIGNFISVAPKLINVKTKISLWLPTIVIALSAVWWATSCSKDQDDYIDDYEYPTITIGTQTWMTENLKVTHYNNGASIANVKNDAKWAKLSKLSKGGYCNYDNVSKNYARKELGFSVRCLKD